MWLHSLRRAPGGVFLTLVKEQCSDEERKDIFFKEKLITDNRKKMKKRLKKKNLDVRGLMINSTKPLIVFLPTYNFDPPPPMLFFLISPFLEHRTNIIPPPTCNKFK